MRIRRPVGLWMGALLIATIGCGADGVTPDPVPAATVVLVTPHRAIGQSVQWGTEVHITFSRDPGPVRLDHGYGPIGEALVGSGTLRAFIAQEEPTSLTWGDGESYDLAEVVGHNLWGPILAEVVPNLYADSVVSAEDLNAAGITLTFAEPISPPDNDPDRLIQLWEVSFLEVEDVTAGISWEPSYSVSGAVLTVLAGQDIPFAPATSYVLLGVIADRFGGHVRTDVQILFSTE